MGKRVMLIFGTRPEAIKMAPVALAMRADPDIEPIICVTAQHRQMLDQVLRIFDLTPDIDLNVMQPGQDLHDVTARIIVGLRDVLRAEHPDLVLVHGDTTTCLSAALAAFYQNIAIGHVEAGLRTFDLSAPFPEEANRSLVGRIANLHFAPTTKAAQNLLLENIPAEHIHVTGNTVIDALLLARDKLGALPAGHWRETLGAALVDAVATHERLILITGHRRENFGQGFLNFCKAIQRLAASHPNWLFVYPVHLNPNVQKPVYDLLQGLANVMLVSPLDYLPFVWLMDRSDLILTDSGGIQEEGPALGKPVLVMRNVTERPEAVEAGTARLVGTDSTAIIDAVEQLLQDDVLYRSMAEAKNPYGDGHASERILRIILDSSRENPSRNLEVHRA